MNLLSRFRALPVLVVALILVGCDAPGTAPGMAAKRSISMTHGERPEPLSAAENAALDRMVAKLPAEHRARARRLIASKIANGHFLKVRDNPELQKALDEVFAERAKARRR
jgi:hypothetical protein